MEVQYSECFGLFAIPVLDIYFSLSLPLSHTFTNYPPSLLLPNPHYFNEYSHSMPRVKPYHESHASFYWKKRFSSREWRSEIAGKFFTSGRHESYNSTVQRGPSPGRVGMSRYENEEQCATAKPEMPGRRRHFRRCRDFVECKFHRKIMNAST